MAKQGSDSSSMELAHYVAVLRRRWRYVAACFALGVVLAGTVAVLTTTRSTATTLVNVNVIAANAFTATRPASDLIDAPTEQAMVRSTRVMTDVAEELGGEWTKASVRASTEATLPPDGAVLRIEFTAATAEDAARGAALIADTYLSYRSEAADERVTAASDRLEERRVALMQELERVNRASSTAEDGSARQLAAEMDRQRISEDLSSVTGQLSELQGINTSGGQVVTEADANQVSTSPDKRLLLVSGALGGLLLGLVLAFVVNILDRRVRDAYDVVGAGGVDVLARLRGRHCELPATGYDIDQVRAVRERLMSTVEARRPVLAVVEVSATDVPPSDLAANLAVSLSDSGLTTDLVLADYPTDALRAVVDALGVQEITPLGRARRFRGGVSETLTVVVPDGTGTRFSTSDLLADLVADDVRVAECTVVGVAPGAGDSVRLTTGRCAHELVFGVHESATTIDDLAAQAAALQSVSAAVLGSVLVPRDRLLGVEGGSAKSAQREREGECDVEPEKTPVPRTSSENAPESAPEVGSEPVPSDVASGVAGERARSLDNASRKGRLRAGNMASGAPVVRVVEPVIVPLSHDESGVRANPGPAPEPGAAPDTESDSGLEVEVEPAAEAEGADVPGEEVSEPPVVQDGDSAPMVDATGLVRDVPPPPREPESLPWAFSR